MAVHLNNHPTGCTFHDWQDVFHEIEDGAELGHFRRDGLTEEEEHFLDLEAVTRGTLPNILGSEVLWKDPVPVAIKNARGVGNWMDPKVVVICLKIDSLCHYDSPRWNGLPAYRRLRPFGTNKRARKFIQKLFNYAGLRVEHTYLTAVFKNWDTENKYLKAEMSVIKTGKIIAIGENTAQEYAKIIGSPPHHSLSRPEFWTTWHQPAWEQYRERFKRCVNDNTRPATSS